MVSNKQVDNGLPNFLLFSRALVFLQFVFYHSLFVKRTENNFTALLVYVDDIILVGNSIFDITEVTQFLDKTFKVKDLKDVKFFLRLEIYKTKDGIYVSQFKYVFEI